MLLKLSLSLHQWRFSRKDKGGDGSVETNGEKKIILILHLINIIYISGIDLNKIKNYSLLVMHFGYAQLKYERIVK